MAQLRQRGAELERAKRELILARRHLAEESTPADPHVLIAPRLRWIDKLLRERWTALQKIPNVAGYAIGHRVRNGLPTDEVVGIVFVYKKRPLTHLRRHKQRAIPRYLRDGKRVLRIDVQELERIHEQTTALAGASIGRPLTPHTKGTIGAPAIDLATNRVVAITAMHVFGLNDFEAGGGIPAIPATVPSLLDDPTAPTFAAVVLGRRTIVDAAKLALAPANRLLATLPLIGPIAGWRPVLDPGDKNTSVQLYGSQSRRLLRGVIVHPRVNLTQSRFQDVILVGGMPTEDGDSGAALLDSQRFILGFLIGSAHGTYEGLRAFCPAGLVLSLLNADIPGGMP